MTIIEQTVDLAGKIRMVCTLSNGQTIMLKFSTAPTLEELTAIEDNYIEAHALDSVAEEKITIIGNKDLFRAFLKHIKQNTELTFNQFSTYYDALQWYEVAQLKAWVYGMALILQEKRDFVLADMSEKEVTQKIRKWLDEKDWKFISKVMYGDTNSFN